jgi:hypothetical protein
MHILSIFPYLCLKFYLKDGTFIPFCLKIIINSPSHQDILVFISLAVVYERLVAFPKDRQTMAMQRDNVLSHTKDGALGPERGSECEPIKIILA